MAAKTEKRYGKRRILLRFDGPKPPVTNVAKFGWPHPPDTRAKGPPTEAPPGQGQGTRAATVEGAKGKDPENRGPRIAVGEGPPATGRKV